MSSKVRHFAKKALYAAWQPELPRDVQLRVGMVVHTERVYDKEIFALTQRFARELQERLSVRAILTVMTGANARVRGGMARHSCSDAMLSDRLHSLNEFADIGLHGHYWMDPDLFWIREQSQSRFVSHSPELALTTNNFALAPFETQFLADLEWIDRWNVPFRKIYSAGWWFLNENVIAALLKHGFVFDFSVSWAPWFRNQYTHDAVVRNLLQPGQPFRLSSDKNHINCVPTLTGCGTADTAADLGRILRAQLGASRDVTGALCIHDYDRNYDGCLAWLEYAAESLRASLWSLESLESPGILDRVPEFDLSTF